jgi:hypothetical protein
MNFLKYKPLIRSIVGVSLAKLLMANGRVANGRVANGYANRCYARTLVP